MKRGTESLIKFKKLKSRLDLPKYQVVGVLTALWATTLREARRGDIGRLSDEDIAADMEWEGNAGKLVNCLVDTGWLDRHKVHRLVVHDWPDHAPTWLCGVLARGEGFAENDAVENRSKLGSNEKGISTSCKPTVVGRQLLGKGRVGKGREGDARGRGNYTPDFEAFWSACPRGRKTKKGVAFKAWLVAIELCDPATLIAKVGEYAASPLGKSEFVQMPQTWLNGRCWDDDPEAWWTHGLVGKERQEAIRLHRKRVEVDAWAAGLTVTEWRDLCLSVRALWEDRPRHEQPQPVRDNIDRDDYASRALVYAHWQARSKAEAAT